MSGVVVHFASATTVTLLRSDPTASISSDDRCFVRRNSSAALPHQFPNLVAPATESMRSHCRHHASTVGQSIVDASGLATLEAKVSARLEAVLLPVSATSAAASSSGPASGAAAARCAGTAPGTAVGVVVLSSCSVAAIAKPEPRVTGHRSTAPTADKGQMERSTKLAGRERFGPCRTRRPQSSSNADRGQRPG